MVCTIIISTDAADMQAVGVNQDQQKFMQSEGTNLSDSETTRKGWQGHHVYYNHLYYPCMCAF